MLNHCTTAAVLLCFPSALRWQCPSGSVVRIRWVTHAHQHQFPACHVGTMLLLLLVCPIPPDFSSLISKYSPSSVVLYVMPHLSRSMYGFKTWHCFMLDALIVLPSLLGLPFSPVLPTLFQVSSWRSCFLFQFPHVCNPLPSHAGPGTLWKQCLLNQWMVRAGTIALPRHVWLVR